MSFDAQVTAILVAYNSEAVIARALASLQGLAAVVVVDNCSSDNTCELVQKQFPGVTLIENKKNEGFGRGNNAGLKKVATPFALLINPDAVLAPGALEKLVAAAERYPDAAILAPALTDESGECHKSFKRTVFEREGDRDTYIEPEGECCAEFLSGAVMLFNMKLMKEIGYFDPEIFLYYEDDDICLRVRRKGYGLVYVPDAKAVHLMGQSSGKAKPEAEFFKQQHLIRSRLYIEKKYRGPAAAKKLATKLRAEYALKAAVYLLTFNKERVNRYRGRLAGVFEFGVLYRHPAGRVASAQDR